MTDTELFAKATLHFAECVDTLAANQARESEGNAPAYDSLESDHFDDVTNEMERRMKNESRTKDTKMQGM